MGAGQHPSIHSGVTCRNFSLMTDFFITGTDTEIGKTYVTCALLRDMRRRGIRAMGYKPVACGDRNDPRAMREASDEPSLSLELINPVFLRAATAPLIAAELEGTELSAKKLAEGYRVLRKQYSPILVEGAGGWEAPLAPGESMADLAQELNLPIILVVGNKLGAVNHAVLTVQSIRSRGLTCRSIVLNHAGEEWEAAELTNRRLIEEMTGIPVSAELVHNQGDIDSQAVLGI